MMRLACIDIGTLTCRLLVADVFWPHDLKEIDADRRILRLGEGVDRSKRLSFEAMDRVVATLKEWKAHIVRYDVEALTIVATSAVRESINREEFLTWVNEETGWNVEVLTGEEEARRTLLGICFGLPENMTHFVGLDIGGGSTEWIFNQGERAPLVISLDLGVVRLLERMFHHDPPSTEELLEAEACIDEQLFAVKEAFGNAAKVPLVGTAGTITTLAAIAQGLSRYDRMKVHNYELTFAAVKRLEQTFITQAGSARLAMAGLEPGREFFIVAGTVILRRIMETFEFDRCLVSDFGLREGILIDLAIKQS